MALLRVLGPVELLDDQSRSLPVGGPIVRLLLVQLALATGEPVPDVQAIDAVWGEDAPDTVDTALRVHMAHLRRCVAPVGGTVVRAHHGYALRGTPLPTDLQALHALETASTRSSSTAALASTVAALALWRGASLADVRRLPLGERLAAGIDQRRDRLLDRQLTIQLALGDLDGVVITTERLLLDDPANELRWGLLATAHYHLGDAARALAVIDRAEGALRRAVGLAIGPSLRDLRQRIQTHRVPAISTAIPLGGGLHGLPATLLALVPERLFGRTEMVVALTKMLDATVERGVSRLLRLVGEAGVGKSAVAAQVALAAEQRGLLVLHGWADEGATAPLGLLAPAIGSLLEDVSDDPALLQARLLLDPLLSGDLGSVVSTAATDFSAERARIVSALRRVLTQSTVRRGVLLVLDDLQWADELSLLFLKTVGRYPLSGPLILLCLSRPSADGGGPEDITLPALTADAVGTWAGTATDAPMTSRLMELTGGLPVLIAPVLAHLRINGSLDGLAENVGQRLLHDAMARLSEQARTLLSMAATVGALFGLDHLAPLSETPIADIGDALDRARAAGLVRYEPNRPGYYRFTHELLRLALSEQVPLATRMGWHARLVDIVGRQSPLRAMRHARSAGPYVKADTLARLTVAVARDLLAARSFESVVTEVSTTVDRAVGALPEHLLATLLTLLGRAEASLGRARLARRHVTEAWVLAQDVEDPAIVAEVFLAQGIFGQTITPTTDSLLALSRLLDRLPTDAHQVRFDVLRQLAFNYVMSGHPELAPSPLAAVQRLASEIDSPLASAQAASLLHLYADDGGRPAERRAAAARLERLAGAHDDSEVTARALMAGMIDALHEGDVDLLARRASTLARDCAEDGDPYREWIGSAGVFAAHFIAGRLPDAVAAAERAFVRGSQSALFGAASAHTVQMFAVGWATGALALVVPEPEGYDLEEPRLAWSGARAVAAMVNGELADAGAVLADLSHDLGRHGRHWIGLVALVLAVEVATVAGLRPILEVAEPILADRVDDHVMLGTATVDFGPAARYLALCEAGLGRLDDALARLTAVARDPRSGPIWQLRGQHDLARLTGTPPPECPLWAWLHRFG